MQVGAGADMLGTPSLYPSIFVNSQCGKNDHKASPANNSWCVLDLIKIANINSNAQVFYLRTMQSFDRGVRSMAVMQITQSVA
jgi:hypothetical protein